LYRMQRTNDALAAPMSSYLTDVLPGVKESAENAGFFERLLAAQCFDTSSVKVGYTSKPLWRQFAGWLAGKFISFNMRIWRLIGLFLFLRCYWRETRDVPTNIHFGHNQPLLVDFFPYRGNTGGPPTANRMIEVMCLLGLMGMLISCREANCRIALQA